MRLMVCLALWATVAAGQGWTAGQVRAAFAPFDHVLLFGPGAQPEAWEHGLTRRDAFQPCSTFKPPHALVALEAGILSLAQNRKICRAGECHADHGSVDLARAIRESCISYFRQTARALGPERLAAGLQRLGYPATGTLEPLDGFWLTGGMRITPDQQFRWIRRFYSETLPVQPEHLVAVRGATLRAAGPDYLLRGKTGASREGFGWFVGEVTRGGQPSYVVVLLRGPGASGTQAERRLRRLLESVP